mmetsp:Transcript_36904/g.108803  ORF Transcript_36904/g.108803 Transcript_36904/m.108803 type:complete len:372 (-) Transcript_36904:2100-3215(-)
MQAIRRCLSLTRRAPQAARLWLPPHLRCSTTWCASCSVSVRALDASSTGTVPSLSSTKSSAASTDSASGPRSGTPSTYVPPTQLARLVFASSHANAHVSSATPPGRRAAATCLSSAAGSGTQSSSPAASTASNWPRWPGKRHASPCTKRTREVSMPSSNAAVQRSVTSPSTARSKSIARASRSLLATSTKRAEMSTPTTSPNAPASVNAARPTAQPRSSARAVPRPPSPAAVRDAHAMSSSAVRRGASRDNCNSPDSASSSCLYTAAGGPKCCARYCETAVSVSYASCVASCFAWPCSRPSTTVGVKRERRCTEQHGPSPTYGGAQSMQLVSKNGRSGASTPYRSMSYKERSTACSTTRKLACWKKCGRNW